MDRTMIAFFAVFLIGGVLLVKAVFSVEPSVHSSDSTRCWMVIERLKNVPMWAIPDGDKASIAHFCDEGSRNRFYESKAND